MVNQTIIDKARRYIMLIPKDMELQKAYIYGSYAKGNANEDSDIDIALIMGRLDDFFKTQIELMRLRREVDLRIEPHPIAISDFNNSNPMAGDIIKTGMMLIP